MKKLVIILSFLVFNLVLGKVININDKVVIDSSRVVAVKDCIIYMKDDNSNIFRFCNTVLDKQEINNFKKEMLKYDNSIEYFNDEKLMISKKIITGAYRDSNSIFITISGKLSYNDDLYKKVNYFSYNLKNEALAISEIQRIEKILNDT